MNKSDTRNTHPGPHIRKTLIEPAELSVTAAAKKLGVGRPALSNMLNGKAALSAEMATRIEKMFGGVSGEELLAMQAEHDRSLAQDKDDTLTVRAYVPKFLNIKAIQIEGWAGRQEARAELSVFIRRLVTSTSDGLLKTDFPGYENSQRKGWDGFSEAERATAWVPKGSAGWEFGTNKEPAGKANKDFEARSSSVLERDRLQTTFIFVTPRNWVGKDAWAREKNALGLWKDVRAYDASDLEQWLEVSVPTQAWMSEQLSLGADAVQSLDASWQQWSNVTSPPLSKGLFGGTVATFAKKLSDWLSSPPKEPLTVSASSVDEALAALSCLFESDAVRSQNLADNVIVIRSLEALAKIASASTDFIVIMASDDAQRESAGIHRKHHTIVIARRNTIEGEPDVFIDLVDDETFRAGLREMELGDEDIQRFGRESGGSLTVLRRRLSKIPAIQTPPWAGQKDVASRLIPLVFIGYWDGSSEADQEILSAISKSGYDEIEDAVAEIMMLDQAPIWSIGQYRGILSKIDAFYAVHPFVTPAHLKRFFEVARVVLSEQDPALDLPESDRWAANIYGKTRSHSQALRQGICETLVFLSVHGANLFDDRTGFSVERAVNQLIFDLLTPLDSRTWQSQRSDLPRYAEAAPETFLTIVEEDLESTAPKLLALMSPADSGGFTSPGRTGLLWALETLAWNKDYLARVVLILGRLSEIQIDDNWVNKPINSLLSIFRAWMPQTAASIEDRISVLELLCRRYPEAGWTICINQFDQSSTIGDYNSRPRWRRDAIGFGEPRGGDERHKFVFRAFELAVNWNAHNAATLGDLVERLDGIDPSEHERIWSTIQQWLELNPSDASKAELRERIRRSTMTRRGKTRGLERKSRQKAKELYEALEPADLVFRHEWLFKRQWVEESADELAEEELNYEARENRINILRESALQQVWNECGYDGVVRLCMLSESPGMIGWHLAAITPDSDEIKKLVMATLTADEPLGEEAIMNAFLSGLFRQKSNDGDRTLVREIISELSERVDKEAISRFLRCAPFDNYTWDLVDTLDSGLKRKYWQEVAPWHLFRRGDGDVIRVVNELLDVERPKAAFNASESSFSQLPSDLLIRLLIECATNSSESHKDYRLQQHDISDAFKELTARQNVSPEELARLEFLYVQALDHTEHGIPNLEKHLGEHPELFVQLLAFAFKRSDDGQDPPSLKPGDPDNREATAKAAYATLHRMKRIPGTKGDHLIDSNKLRNWITQVIELAEEHARRKVAESMIGELLGRSPYGEDGIWPHEAIREVLEEVGSKGLASGMRIGRSNSRGVVSRGEGGGQERELASNYYVWANKISKDFPFTGRLLKDLAIGYEREAKWYDADSDIRRRLED